MRYSSLFCCLFGTGDTFSTWKMEVELCGNLLSCRTLFFIEIYYIHHNPQTTVALVEQLSRKFTMCFPLHLEKLEKETKFGTTNGKRTYSRTYLTDEQTMNGRMVGGRTTGETTYGRTSEQRFRAKRSVCYAWNDLLKRNCHAHVADDGQRQVPPPIPIPTPPRSHSFLVPRNRRAKADKQFNFRQMSYLKDHTTTSSTGNVPHDLCSITFKKIIINRGMQII